MARYKLGREQSRTMKELVVKLRGDGMPYKDIAKKVSMSASYVKNIVARHKQEEAAKPVLASLMMGRIDGKMPANGHVEEVKETTIAETGPVVLTGEPVTVELKPAEPVRPRTETTANRYAMLEDLAGLWQGTPDDVKQAFMLLEGLVKKA